MSQLRPDEQDMSRPIRVLGLAGSPRRHGNTETLLDRFLAGAREAGAEVEKVVVARLGIAACIACGGCAKEGACVVQDEFQRVNEALVASDVIVLASPLFFWNVPAQVKALIDRGQSQWSRKFLVQKPLPPTPAGNQRRRGVFICVGADRRRHFEGVLRTVQSFFLVYEADNWGQLLYNKIEDKQEIENHPTAMQEAYDLGRRAVLDDWDTG
jgi:multimeric flavodoxin WrbA